MNDKASPGLQPPDRRSLPSSPGYLRPDFPLRYADAVDFAIAALYVVVVLLAANYFQRRGVLLVSLGCVALTVLSFLLTHGFVADDSLARCLVSVAAIGATTVLALQSQSANVRVHRAARLLDLTHDTIFVRDMNDVITYWNRGAEELYGWRKDEALGKVTHQILQSVFPAPLNEITEELLRNGRWEGELVHTKRDGISCDRGEPVVPAAGRARAGHCNHGNQQRHHGTQSGAACPASGAGGDRSYQSCDDAWRVDGVLSHLVNQPLTGVVTNALACLRLLDLDPPDLGEVRSAMEGIVSDGMCASDEIQRVRALSQRKPTCRWCS